MIGARVRVVLKRSVLDPQGDAVARSLRSLGYESVRDVRVGKLIELVLDVEDELAARGRIDEMAKGLLVNGVIETYEVELVDASLVGGLGLQEAGACV